MLQGYHQLPFEIGQGDIRTSDHSITVFKQPQCDTHAPVEVCNGAGQVRIGFNHKAVEPVHGLVNALYGLIGRDRKGLKGKGRFFESADEAVPFTGVEGLCQALKRQADIGRDLFRIDV